MEKKRALACSSALRHRCPPVAGGGVTSYVFLSCLPVLGGQERGPWWGLNWHQRCVLVRVSESRLQANVVGRSGEPLQLHRREMFSLLAHLSWHVRMRTQENAVVMWERKQTTEHPYEWQVRVRVFLATRCKRLVMGATLDAGAHSV